MAAPTKLELSVKLTCQDCVDAVKSALAGEEGVKVTGIDLDVQRVLVETSLPSAQVVDIIESTGRRAVIVGVGGTNQKSGVLGAAVAMMSGSGAQGVVRLVQTDECVCVIEGTLDGLSPGSNHKLAIHEYGDISDGCSSCGDIFHMQTSAGKHLSGDLGRLTVNEAGRTRFRLAADGLNVCDTIGRSMVIHQFSDVTPGGDTRLACGIIARSSGLFENAKRICACDGVTLWDEREVPLAGPQRQAHAQL